jgi:Uma2 family endonuclease
MTQTEIRDRVPPAAENGAEPAWEVAYLFPYQGEWSEGDYLSLGGSRLVELVDGRLEVLPMPGERHQLIVACLYGLLAAFVRARRLGVVLFAPLSVRVGERRFREPDVVFMRQEHAGRRHGQYWEQPDLVMEVVSPDGRDRDLVEKRADYARAGIPEYWIVDPEEERILVLALDGESYRVHGDFRGGDTAASPTLPGFSVPVDDALNAAG